MNKPEPTHPPENPKQQRIGRNDTDYDAATQKTNPKKYQPVDKEKTNKEEPHHPNYPETQPNEPTKTDKEVTDLEGFNRPFNEPRERESK